MNSNKLIFTTIIITLFIGLWGLINQSLNINIVAHILPTLLIALWFYLQVKSNFNTLNKYIFFSIALDSLSYPSMLLAFNYFYGLFSVFTGMLLIIVLTFAIRQEGTNFRENPNFSNIKVLFPFFIIFIVYAIFLLPVLPEIPLVFTTIYAIIEVIFISHVFLRKVNKTDYWLTGIGAILLFIKDLLYAIHYYVLDKEFFALYIIIFFMSPILYLMIVLGLTNNRKSM